MIPPCHQLRPRRVRPHPIWSSNTAINLSLSIQTPVRQRSRRPVSPTTSLLSSVWIRIVSPQSVLLSILPRLAHASPHPLPHPPPLLLLLPTPGPPRSTLCTRAFACFRVATLPRSLLLPPPPPPLVVYPEAANTTETAKKTKTFLSTLPESRPYLLILRSTLPPPPPRWLPRYRLPARSPPTILPTIASF